MWAAGLAQPPSWLGKVSWQMLAQERSSHWCQDLLIALLLGTAFSRSPGIALAVRKKGPSCLSFCGNFFPQDKDWLSYEIQFSEKGSRAAPSFPAGSLFRLEGKLTWPRPPGEPIRSVGLVLPLDISFFHATFSLKSTTQ